MILTKIMRLEAVLDGSVSANQPEVHVDYQDWTDDNQQTRPATYRTAMNNGTTVTILAAPTDNPIREPLRVIIYNKDTATRRVIVKTDDDSNERIEINYELLTLETLCWEKSVGWYNPQRIW